MLPKICSPNKFPEQSVELGPQAPQQNEACMELFEANPLVSFAAPPIEQAQLDPPEQINDQL